ncbi:MAG: hypothetical protein ACFFDN_02595 [Candidatus Hodarchaeota archaeon]
MKKESSVEEDLVQDQILKQEQSKTDLANTCELLLNEKWRRRKTILKGRYIADLTTLENIADLYEIQWLREWIDNFTEYVTSIDGKGRKDIVDIAKYSIDKADERQRELLDVLGRR